MSKFVRQGNEQFNPRLYNNEINIQESNIDKRMKDADLNKYSELYTLTNSHPYFTGTVMKYQKNESTTI